MDTGGRVVFARLLDDLGWGPGTRLATRIHREQIGVLSPGRGPALSKHRHLCLPIAVRRRLGLTVGDQLLMAVHRERRLLLVASARLLDEQIGGRLRAAIEENS
ncbi:hypothetical protein [Nocardia asteroides]|uniref:hypothetical protein n=1 Tax=Nocardia asteroides TaxID=1824 RepID=UPI001E37A0AD|nr:hypothetical protein [Nocardia asteroides]UGT61856.1 hypothetical protein LTT61_00410 [Nocardia asteroides]